MKIRDSYFNCGCILKVFWTIYKKQIYAWLVVKVFKTSQFFVKAFKIINIRKIIEKVELKSPKLKQVIIVSKIDI